LGYSIEASYNLGMSLLERLQRNQTGYKDYIQT